LTGGGLLAGFQQLGSVALNAAVEIDKSRQTLIALTGSADAANRKLAELRQVAQQTPGLTSRVAIDVFSQLKATGQIAEDSINRLIKGVGRLNAVFTIDDAKQFSRNLVQIFQQGFERADIKEALGRVPIFEQILQQAFGTNDAGKLRKLKESGKLTLDSFASGLAEAIGSNPVLANVQESLGSRFEKAKDNILVALEPLGAEIGKILLSFADEVGKQLAASQDSFSDLIAAAKDFGNTIVSSAGDGASRFFDLRKEIEDVKNIIDFLNGGVLFLKDSFELLGTPAVGAISS
jgi:tape measure domain-containing protein